MKEKIKSKYIPNNIPSLEDWLKEFTKPILSSTNTKMFGGSIKTVNNGTK